MKHIFGIVCLGIALISASSAFGQANDTCAGAVALSSGVVYSMDTTFATDSGDPLPSCLATFGHGVWFTFTPTADGLVNLDTCGSGFDTILQVYTGSCGALTTVSGGCDDDNGPVCAGAAASVSFNGTNGVTYWILAGGFGGDFGILQILASLVTTGGTPDIRISPATLTFNSGATNPPIYVEIDWMETTGHTHKPSTTVVNRIVQAFAVEGYDLFLDVSQAIPEQTVLPVINAPSSSPAVQTLMNTYFNHMNDSRYFYSIWCHNYSYNGSSTTSSGIADLPGRVHLVSLGSFSGQTGTPDNQVGTFVHEFGHNLNQKHGGADHDNYKPNYISVMNYFFQLGGVGPTLLSLGLVNSSAGFNNFGYSHGDLPNLDENHLNEPFGIGLGRAVSWNCDGDSTDLNLAKDINNSSSWCSANSTRSIISDFDNWAGIVGNIRTSLTPLKSDAPVESSKPCIGVEEYKDLQDLLARLVAERGEKVPPQDSSDDVPVKLDKSGNNKLRFNATTFTVFNDGGGDLTVSSIITNQPAPWLSFWPPAPFTLPAGQSRKVTVTVNYDLAPYGTTTRRLVVSSDDPDESPYPGAVDIVTTRLVPPPPFFSSFGRTNGLFQFVVSGQAGANCVIQTSSNLITWASLATNVIGASGTLTNTDAGSANASVRFYRAILP